MSRQWHRCVTYRFHLQKSRVNAPEKPPLGGPATRSSHVLDHARTFGMFTAQQVHPVGPVYTFVVLQQGVEFIAE